MKHVRIETDMENIFSTRVWCDGEEQNGLLDIKFEHKVNEIPKITLQYLVYE